MNNFSVRFPWQRQSRDSGKGRRDTTADFSGAIGAGKIRGVTPARILPRDLLGPFPIRRIPYPGFADQLRPETDQTRPVILFSNLPKLLVKYEKVG